MAPNPPGPFAVLLSLPTLACSQMTHFHNSTMNWQWLPRKGGEKWCGFPIQCNVIWLGFLSGDFRIVSHTQSSSVRTKPHAGPWGRMNQWNDSKDLFTVRKWILRLVMLGCDWVLGGGDWVQIYYPRREVEVSRKCPLRPSLSIRKTRLFFEKRKSWVERTRRGASREDTQNI